MTYLSQNQLNQYQKLGYIFLPNYFSQPELEKMQAELPSLYHQNTPDRVLEADGKTVRAVHGVHTRNEVYKHLVRLPKMLEPAQQILQSPVYVHQFKINAKLGMRGDVWEWHQDFTFWHIEDGMPEPQALNLVVFLDDVTEFNGPLILIPGSHQEGMLNVTSKNKADKEAWLTTLTASLKHTLNKEMLKKLSLKYELVAPKGSAGSVLIFHPSVVHGSVPNISPFDRNLVIISYNSTQNVLQSVPNPRPEFLAARDFTPLKPLDKPL